MIRWKSFSNYIQSNTLRRQDITLLFYAHTTFALHDGSLHSFKLMWHSLYTSNRKTRAFIQHDSSQLKSQVKLFVFHRNTSGNDVYIERRLVLFCSEYVSEYLIYSDWNYNTFLLIFPSACILCYHWLFDPSFTASRLNY